jgi:NAD(P)-dependent dehydrogenase (short-subunit alcohol dehydrogenase family)
MPTVIITGATRGIGRAAAVELAQRGAEVAVVGREPDRVRETGAHGHLADLARMDEVRRLAAELRARYPRIDVLANNAGAMFTARHTTPDGYEQTFALNHLAPFLLTNLLLDRLTESRGRVITTSSDAHRGGVLDLDDLQSQHGRFKAMGVYGTSKLCNILFTRELQKRAPELHANCFHPGVIRTGFGKNDGLLARAGLTLIGPFLAGPKKGAETLVSLALDPQGGELRGQYLEQGRVKEPSAQAQDDRLAAELWERSAALTLGRGAGDPVVAD